MRPSATLFILISCFFVKFARSQSNELVIQGETGKLYLEHTVVAKENWYSVGRLYNVTPKELTAFNHLTLAQPLIIGQNLQIPLTVTNFSQNGLKAAGETLVPVIHITQEKEWMYRISVNHNKVPIPNIEKWNNVTPDQIHPGMHLIIGYLKVKTGLSALATKPTGPAAEPTTPDAVATKKPVAVPPASAQVTPPSTTTTPASTPTTAASTPVTSTPPAPVPTPSTPVTSAPVTAAPATTTPVTSAPVGSSPSSPTAPAASTTPAAPHFNGGNFRSDYTDGSKSASGPAGIFKSTSGWQDGKYYALMNNVTVGTIVKITDPTTNKTVYAKILGALPEMKESSGLAIRMSNAAAAELGESDSRFNVQINY